MNHKQINNPLMPINIYIMDISNQIRNIKHLSLLIVTWISLSHQRLEKRCDKHEDLSLGYLLWASFWKVISMKDICLCPLPLSPFMWRFFHSWHSVHFKTLQTTLPPWLSYVPLLCIPNNSLPAAYKTSHRNPYRTSPCACKGHLLPYSEQPLSCQTLFNPFLAIQ